MRLVLFRKDRIFPFGILLIACLCIPLATYAELPDRLVFKSASDIQDHSVGLTEPSGLTLSDGKQSLWTVSDSTSRIFQLKFNGYLEKGKSISDSYLRELEGVAISNDGKRLYLVKEDTSEIIEVSMARKEISTRASLTNMIGYDGMRKNAPNHFVPGLGDNKGLEGIVVHPDTGEIYVLKETGLLIKLSADLSAILLTFELDFADDYSGICFQDAALNIVWIVSDKSKKIYLYDLDRASILKAFKLKDGRGKTYSSAEGVAYDSDTRELFVVTDKGHTLYTYEVK